MSLFITATALAFASPAHAAPLNPTTQQSEAPAPEEEDGEEVTPEPGFGGGMSPIQFQMPQ